MCVFFLFKVRKNGHIILFTLQKCCIQHHIYIKIYFRFYRKNNFQVLTFLLNEKLRAKENVCQRLNEVTDMFPYKTLIQLLVFRKQNEKLFM